MKTRTWILCIAALLAVSLGLSLWLLRPTAAARAEIWSDGALLRTVDLSVEQTLTVRSPYGVNVVAVRDGRIAVTEADCPDGYCMDRGFCGGGAQIVCLPNRLVIRFLAEPEIDGVAG